jgi:hypothetical protein
VCSLVLTHPGAIGCLQAWSFHFLKSIVVDDVFSTFVTIRGRRAARGSASGEIGPRQPG